MTKEHKHLILKGYLSKPPVSEDEVIEALKDIVELINMQVLAKPRARYSFAKGNDGLTGDVLLTTGHLIWHDWETDDPEDNGADLQLDLYSCAEFDTETVITYLIEEFGLVNYEYKLFDRTYNLVQTGERYYIDREIC